MIPQLDALKLQLAAITGNEPASSFLEIRPLGRDGRPAVRERDHAAQRCLELAGTLNVYVGAAPRVREEGVATAVARVWCLWCDCDGRDALERLVAFQPLPSIIIRSGSDDHAHAYWSLREPLAPEWAERANRRLAFALSGDPASTDRARILRAAGTLNHKHDPPRPVVCTRLEPSAFTFAEVVGGLSDPPEFARRQEQPRPSGSPGGALAGAARRVREAAQGERNHVLNWAAWVMAPRVASGELSESDVQAALLDAALAAGLGEREALRTVLSGLTRKVAA